MYNPDSVLENKTHKHLRDFEGQTVHQIAAWRPERKTITKEKRTCWIEDLVVSAVHRVELKANENRGKTLDQRIDKNLEHESDGDTNCH